MDRPRVAGGIAVLLVAVCALLTSQLVTPSLCDMCEVPDAVPVPAAAADLATSRASTDVMSETEEDSAVDMYGNEISSAVAQYKLDATGSLYELHSPNTALPRLVSPRT